VLDGLQNDSAHNIVPEVKNKVLDICKRFPVYI